MRGRIVAYGVLAIVVVAMLAPWLWPPSADSFPLSTYPMFSTDRGNRSSVATVVGLDAAGEEHRLSPELIGGSDEPMLAVATATRARQGRAAQQRLCEQVAARVAASERDELDRVTFQVETYDPVRHFTGDDGRISADVLATCDVER